MTPCDDCIVTIRPDNGPAVRFGNDHYGEIPTFDSEEVSKIIKRESMERYSSELREREVARMEPAFEFQLFTREKSIRYGIKRAPKVELRKR